MKVVEIKSEIEVYDHAELSDADKELLNCAQDACDQSYSPYSNFKVGCAIRLESSEIVMGANQENAAYPVCLCAEGVALANASMRYPKTPISTIAITVKTKTKAAGKPVAPCGLCRQSILEYENRFLQSIRILLRGESGEVYMLKSIKDILPLSFGSKDLNS